MPRMASALQRSSSSDYKSQLCFDVGPRTVGNSRGDFKLLEAKMLAEKKMLEQRLISLRHPAAGHLKARRPYPPVLPKFANPDEPSQVWAGRGKRPRWVIEKLATGLDLEDLSIGRGSSVAMP